jgi:glycosyl transferase, family 25
MNIRLISMESSHDRRRAFLAQNPHLRFDIFNAIEGAKLSREYLASTGLFEEGLPYTPGGYGSALSHLALWEEAIQLNKPVTIAEDDAIFRFDFEAIATRKLNALPPDWDLVLWGWNFDNILSLNAMPDVSPAVMMFNQEQMRNSVPAFQHSRYDVALFRLDKCFGIPAYTLSAKGAAKFKSLCFPLSNFTQFFPLINKVLPNHSLDYAMNRVYATTQTFVAFPPLAITRNEHSISTIQPQPAAPG